MFVNWYDGSKTKPNLIARVVTVTEVVDGMYTPPYEFFFKNPSDAVDAMNQANKLLASLAERVR